MVSARGIRRVCNYELKITNYELNMLREINIRTGVAPLGATPALVGLMDNVCMKKATNF